jgi:hypothetical protein
LYQPPCFTSQTFRFLGKEVWWAWSFVKTDLSSQKICQFTDHNISLDKIKDPIKNLEMDKQEALQIILMKAGELYQAYTSGFLGREDFRKFFDNISASLAVPAITDTQLDEYTKTVKNGDGKLSFEELLNATKPILD